MALYVVCAHVAPHAGTALTPLSVAYRLLARGLQRETGTTAGSAMRPPAKNREYERQLKRGVFRCGMVTEETLAEAKISWCALAAGVHACTCGFAPSCPCCCLTQVYACMWLLRLLQGWWRG